MVFHGFPAILAGSPPPRDFFDFPDFSDFFGPGSGTTTFYCSEAIASSFVDFFCVFGKREVRRGKFGSCFGADESARERNPQSVGDRRGLDGAPDEGVGWDPDPLRKMLCEKSPPP